ncbi:MAG: hypothetical protein A4E19_16480 [Nitrospira sp. SG-bin1]|nr:MAG: hypothetical protein A4E19_16480 [Nitrospira sp. SG-bin1]
MLGAAMSPLTIAILSSQWLLWVGLQKILESHATIPMVVHRHPWRTSAMFHSERPPDLFILDLETERNPTQTITQIRETAPGSKIVLLCGIEDKDRTREAFISGVDGIILTVQPPEVVLAVIEALYTPAKLQLPMERDNTGGSDVALSAKKKSNSDTPPGWPEALTEREREIIRLVEQGLSNKDIAYKLSISDSTVRHHMTNIFDKVGVPNRQKLLIRAHQFSSNSA